MKSSPSILVLVLAILFGVVAFFLFTENDRLNSLNRTYESNNEILQEQIIVTRDSAGRERAKVATLVTTVEGLKSINDSQAKRIKDYNIKLKNVKAVASLEQVAQIQLNLDVKDSTDGIKTIKYKGPDFSFNQIIKGDKSVIVPTFNFEQDIIFHTEKRPKKHVFDFIRPDQLTVEVINKNPYVTTKSIQAKYVEPRKKWYERKVVYFGIGILAGVFLTK